MKVVVGKGISGRSAEAFLKAAGEEVTVIESSDPVPPHDEIILSPGVRASEFPGAVGEMELGLRNLKEMAIGVTGTNGKTTLTAYLATLFEGTAVGNIGLPLTQALLENRTGPYIIEMSSYQLETSTTPTLDGAIILNITPDHLDRHGTMENYIAAKCRIGKLLKPGAPLWVGPDVPCDGIRLNTEEWQEVGAVIARHFGVRKSVPFSPPPHRLEKVAELEGVTFYNDSKATNVAAVKRAVRSVPGPVYLIAGGRHKGSPYSPWNEERIAHIFTLGEAAEQIEREVDFPTTRTESLEEAVEKAFALADGGSILLSPGCSSFDMFKNFEARGNDFKQLVTELTERLQARCNDKHAN